MLLGSVVCLSTVPRKQWWSIRSVRPPSGSLTIHTMVTGEGVGFEAAAAQPGGRPPAPGDLALVQAFVNSHYDLELEHGADLFATPAQLGRWLSARGLVAASARLRARDQSCARGREGLRRLPRNHRGRRSPPRACTASTGPRPRPEWRSV